MKKQKQNKRNKFNFYWIYVIIGVIFFGLQIVGVISNSKETNWEEFNTKMLHK